MVNEHFYIKKNVLIHFNIHMILTEHIYEKDYMKGAAVHIHIRKKQFTFLMEQFHIKITEKIIHKFPLHCSL